MDSTMTNGTVHVQVHKLNEDIEALRDDMQAKRGHDAQDASSAAACSAEVAGLKRRLGNLDDELSSMQVTIINISHSTFTPPPWPVMSIWPNVYQMLLQRS
jgi:ABC-type phosphate transport system auxiliary subunit